MKQSTLVLYLLFGVCVAFWRNVVEIDPDSLNPLNLLYTNRCIEDLGCFDTGPPFYHAVNRPISLPPTSDPRTKFLLFTPSNPLKAYELEYTEASVLNSTFNPLEETKIYVHGFLSDLEYDDVRYATKDALLNEGGYNVILVDWTENNGLPYAQAVANTRVVGAQVAKLINLLVNTTDISPTSVHIIGHSLGSHVAGYAGKRVPNMGRITGLDPAGPYFQDADAEVRLYISDANFVDIIHTDGGEFVLNGFGLSKPIGHIDFYPNGGRLQPGCSYTSSSDSIVGAKINFTMKLIPNPCDHSRASDLFLESIYNLDCRFLSVHCSNYTAFENGHCPPQNSTVAEMGFHAQKIDDLEPPAKFFLRTNGSMPFCIENSIYL